MGVGVKKFKSASACRISLDNPSPFQPVKSLIETFVSSDVSGVMLSVRHSTKNPFSIIALVVVWSFDFF